MDHTSETPLFIKYLQPNLYCRSNNGDADPSYNISSTFNFHSSFVPTDILFQDRFWIYDHFSARWPFENHGKSKSKSKLFLIFRGN